MNPAEKTNKMTKDELMESQMSLIVSNKKFMENEELVRSFPALHHVAQAWRKHTEADIEVVNAKAATDAMGILHSRFRVVKGERVLKKTDCQLFWIFSNREMLQDPKSFT